MARGLGLAPEDRFGEGLVIEQSIEHNLALLASLAAVAGGRPLLVGASRKRFIAHLTGAEVDDRLGGSLAALAAAYAGRTDSRWRTALHPVGGGPHPGLAIDDSRRLVFGDRHLDRHRSER